MRLIRNETPTMLLAQQKQKFHESDSRDYSKPCGLLSARIVFSRYPKGLGLSRDKLPMLNSLYALAGDVISDAFSFDEVTQAPFA